MKNREKSKDFRLGVRLRESDILNIDTLCQHKNMTRSDCIRHIIAMYDDSDLAPPVRNWDTEYYEHPEKVICFRADSDTIGKINKLSYRTNRTQSEVVRDAIQTVLGD
jgi:hypothetical protein